MAVINSITLTSDTLNGVVITDVLSKILNPATKQITLIATFFLSIWLSYLKVYNKYIKYYSFIQIMLVSLHYICNSAANPEK